MIATTTQPRRILIVTNGHSAHRAIFDLLPPGTVEIQEARDLTAAIDALRDGRFDLVVSEVGDFAALERAVCSGQSIAIMDRLDQGVCMIDATGRVLWANAKMRSFPEELRERIRDHCVKALAVSPEMLAARPSRHLSVPTADDQHYEVEATAIQENGGPATQMLAVAWDVSHTRRLQRKIDAIDLAGRELVSLELETIANLDADARLKLLEDKILKYTSELLNFDNFLVMLIDRKTNKLEPLLQHGMQKSLEQLDIYVSTEGNGISGYVAATGRSYICHDTSRDPRYIQGLANARSSLTVPLRRHNKVIGVFNIESQRPAAFNEDDRQFVEILARYIALSIQVMEQLVAERYTATESLAEDVASEISRPLNDIVTNTASLMEEYISHEGLHRRLGCICDNVAEIRRTIREVGHPVGGLLGPRRSDGPRDPLLEGRRVLIADDEELIRDTVCDVLTRQGCHVDMASDGAEAVRLIRSQPYDLVLSDIKMPNKNGYEVFAAARDCRDGVPVILITGFGYDPNHVIVRARREGLAAVLFKPFKIELLLEEVHKALKGPVQPQAEQG